MPYECAECGRVHDDLPRYFMCRAPERQDGSVLPVQHDRKSMCRADQQYFVCCEIEFPLADASGDPLGYICWVEVATEAYERLKRFREDEASEPNPRVISGTLANELRAVPGSFGTHVRFDVVEDDPTPYIRWIAPGTALAHRVSEGATAAFWRELAAAFTASPS